MLTRIARTLVPTVALIMSTAQYAPAQDVSPEAQRRAAEMIKEADKYFKSGGYLFTKALPLYEQAYEITPDDPILNLKIGLCHLNARYHHKALPYFQRAAELDPSLPRVQFLLGYALQINGQWDKAVEAYEAHKASTMYTPDPEAFYNSADKRIVECRNGKTLEARPGREQVENLSSRVNGELADYGSLFTPDGRTMYFTSRRPNTTGGKLNKSTNEYFEDIYETHLTEGGWSEPAPLPAPVNTSGNDATVALCQGGTKLLIYRDEQGMGDIWMSEATDGNWGTPKRLGANVNSKNAETSAWISDDGEWIYFVSDRAGGLGGQDIWRSRWDAATNDWGPAENLGPTVNTIQDEDGVFLAADGHTLYFSSKGHTCMGGYDVFRTTLADGQWSQPENLGWPINSPDDDIFFVLDQDGGTGYFSSIRAGGAGDDDIFRVRFHQEGETAVDDRVVSAAGAAPAMSPARVMIHGRVKVLKMMTPVEASIELIDLDDAGTITRVRTDASNGTFAAAVAPGRSYALYVRADGYLMRSERVEPPDTGYAAMIDMDIPLQPIENGGQEVLRNLFFDRDQATLSERSLAEMGQLLDLLRSNPDLRLEIGGHTDSDGTPAHNKELSEARAQAVLHHLLNNGIAAQRLTARGYGDAQPIAPNDSEQNKARNRRTGIRVISN